MRNFASAVLPQAILLPPLLPQNGGFPAKTIDNNRLRKCDSVLKTHALVAQLDRASVCETLAGRLCTPAIHIQALRAYGIFCLNRSLGCARDDICYVPNDHLRVLRCLQWLNFI